MQQKQGIPISDEELEELLEEIRTGWINGDPVIRNFVDRIRKIGNPKTHLAKEVMVEVIAELLKRLLSP